MTPQIRRTIYQLGTLVSSVLGLALIWGGISQGTADHINTVLAGLIALISGGAPAVAARTVKEQTKQGAFDAVPNAEAAIKYVQAAFDDRERTAADAQRIVDVVANALPTAVSTAAQQVGGLVDQAIAAARKG